MKSLKQSINESMEIQSTKHITFSGYNDKASVETKQNFESTLMQESDFLQAIKLQNVRFVGIPTFGDNLKGFWVVESSNLKAFNVYYIVIKGTNDNKSIYFDRKILNIDLGQAMKVLYQKR